MSTTKIVAIVTALVAGSSLVLAGFFVWMLHGLRNTPATTSAVAAAERDPRVTAITGTPLKAGWFVVGHIGLTTRAEGEATLTIPVSGPQGKGTVYVVEHNGFAGWTPTTLEFWPAQHPNDIVRIVEPGTAQ